MGGKSMKERFFSFEFKMDADPTSDPKMVVYPNDKNQFVYKIVDKNNQEIYDGDLIKFADKILQIKWSKLLARFVGETIDNKHDLFACYQDLYEIVGNIYKNPEILKKREIK